MKLIQISDFKIGRSIQGFYLCREKNIRHTRSGDLFLDMIFSDSTGSIPGKLWDLADQFQDRFERGDPVAVKGKVSILGGYFFSIQLCASLGGLSSLTYYR